MSDARDLNKDGKVSMVEKVKDKLHLGHKDKDTYTTTHSTTATTGSSHLNSGFTDARDLNRDGHISTSEKLATSHMGSGFTDSRDLNRDGHVSTAEKLASGSHTEEARLRLHEEQLAISKREVGAGEVGIHKRVQQETVQQTIPVRREEVTVERHPLHGVPEPGARIAAQDEVVRVPLAREEIITEKRVVPTEEVVVRKKEIVDNQTVGATLRSEYVDTAQTAGIAGTHKSALESRDLNRDGHVSMGEKFKTAPDTNGDGHVSMGEKLKGAARG